MIEQLEQLCWAIGAVTPNQARQVVEAVNRRLSNFLVAQIVKLYWKQEAQEGLILEPIAYINETQSLDPQRFPLAPTSVGVLQWVFNNKTPLWLEEVGRHSHDESLLNLATKEHIPRELLDLSDPPQSDSMMVVPIFERREIHGLYSVELQASGRLTDAILPLMRRLSRSVGTLLYNADVHEYDLAKTSKAIRQFLDDIQGFKFEPRLLEQNHRMAFVARPFGAEFNPLQDRVEGLLASRGIRARHYVPDAQKYIIDEIISQIRMCHFCIADITGSNANVVAEVGMMMALGKRLLVLARRGNAAPIPFDLAQFPILEYELGGNPDELLVWSPQDNRLISFGETLDRFLK